MTKKLIPFVNRFTGEVKILTKSQGKHLNEDWGRVEMATNEKGDKVMRFKLDGAVKDKDGNIQQGTATVDISPNEIAKAATDGNGHTK